MYIIQSVRGDTGNRRFFKTKFIKSDTVRAKHCSQQNGNRYERKNRYFQFKNGFHGGFCVAWYGNAR